MEELRLRKYSNRTIKRYVDVVDKFLMSGKHVREFLLSHSGKSKAIVRGIYFALKFFYENAIGEKFDERIPLAKKSMRLPLVLSKEEVKSMFKANF